MPGAVLFVFDGDDQYQVNLTVHPQVQAMLGADVGNPARDTAWSGMLELVRDAVAAARVEDAL